LTYLIFVILYLLNSTNFLIYLDKLSDAIIESIAEKTHVGCDELASRLNIGEKTMERIRDHSENLILDVIKEWRESDEVVKYGEDAVGVLETSCGVNDVC